MKTYLHVCNNEFLQSTSLEEFIYFIRSTEGMIPVLNSLEEVNSEMPKHCEIGFINGPPLVQLEQLLTKVIC